VGEFTKPHRDLPIITFQNLGFSAESTLDMTAAGCDGGGTALLARLEIPNGWYHVINRGHQRKAIFRDRRRD
jgi:hypothetical protein